MGEFSLANKNLRQTSNTVHHIMCLQSNMKYEHMHSCSLLVHIFMNVLLYCIRIFIALPEHIGLFKTAKRTYICENKINYYQMFKIKILFLFLKNIRFDK